MKHRTLWYVVGGLGTGLFLGVAWGLFRPQASVAPTVTTNSANTNLHQTETNEPVATGVTMFSTVDLPDRDPAFSFTAEIPTAWAVEYVPASQAINIYDPRGSASSSLDNGKIFVRFFSASSFQTLSTVDILERTESTVVNRPAVTYIIKKKASVTDFPNQPDWRNDQHRVTDIRVSDENPSTFYVFAKAPDVTDATFDAFLASLTFTTETVSSVVYPLKDFLARITKKRFGQYITPQNSPVSPERFSGYHTGVDAEATSTERGQDVPVYAVADGTITLRQTVNGYGGVVMIEHQVDDETVTALYGHLDLRSVTASVGTKLRGGQQFAVLGADQSTETDGERQHLHLGLLRGSSRQVQGYVGSADGLGPWIDPVVWFDAVEATEVTSGE